MSLRKIRFHCADFCPGTDPIKNRLVTLLSEFYDLEPDPVNPEYLLYQSFGWQHLFYDDCIKLCLHYENITPDFNICDYGIGFDHISFGDRYLRMPYWHWRLTKEDQILPDADFFQKEALHKTKFCNFIYSNHIGNCAHPLRDHFFHFLSQYKHVESGGKHLNNIGYPVEDKVAWQRQFKFSITFENSSKPGYATEKLLDALRAHTIPIYWGDPLAAHDFNQERFINCHNFQTFDEVLAYVRHLDENPAAYLDMLSKPWFAGALPDVIEENQALIRFVRNIFEQEPAYAKRAVQFGWTKIYLGHLRQAFAPQKAFPDYSHP